MANGSSGSSPSPAPAPTSPVQAPLAQVAPGSSGYNTLCAPGVAAMILGDFDRTGMVNHTDPEYLSRITRPGAIVLPNLDIDDPTRVTAFPANLASLLDASDARVNTAADEPDLSIIKLRKPAPCPVGAASALIRVHANDGQRIRLFQIGAWPDPVLGPGKLSSGPQNEFAVVNPTGSNPYAYDYRVEALSLAGDPNFPSPSGATPNLPTAFPATVPPGSTGSPIYANRGPGEIWIEIVHRDSGGADLALPRDVAVLTIAPFMLLSNLEPLEQAFVVYEPSFNHDFVYDIAEALSTALGSVTVSSDTSTPLVPHRPVHDRARTPQQVPGGLYIIDGTRYGDVWIQDEMEIGYAFAPHGWMHVVMHCKRNRPLAQFVDSELAAPGVGLFTGLSSRPGGTSIDYGGNIEVSPPVSVDTPALPRDGAGPAVKAHRLAPFGKILIGDCNPRPFDSEGHRFLEMQKAQPILPFDTSWLAVGHIDEVTSFVPSSRGRGHLLIMASVRAMHFLLEELQALPFAARTSFHCGKYEDPRDRASYNELTVDALLATRNYNERVRNERLAPIQRRLTRGLDLRADEIIPFPTYFKLPTNAAAPFGSPANQTVAETVGSVNLLVANRHLLIPRPFGPRLDQTHCMQVLTRVFSRLGISVTPRVPSATGFWFWVFPGENSMRVAAYFTHPTSAVERENIIDYIVTGTGLTPANSARVMAISASIAAVPANATMIGSINLAGNFTTWRRLWIPSTTVDVMEAFMHSLLEPHGLTLHFIDDFHAYHVNMGEVHCGTNARRTPPELTRPERWWQTYDPDHDLQYSP